MNIQESKLKIPVEELLYIMPEPRQKLFMNMLHEYKVRYPNYKLLYAYLNCDSSLAIDYLIIFEAIGEKTGLPTIIYDIPYLYNTRTTPGYRYCLREGILDDFFEDAINNMTTLSKSRFNEYLNNVLELSVKSNDERYWKLPNFTMDLAKGLADLSLYYVKKD